MNVNFLVILRVLVAAVFVSSGFGKLIGPYQNFLFVVQGYELFTPGLERAIAHVMPWVEFLSGVFLLLGFRLRWTFWALLATTAGFIGVVGQALVRELPITSCGCFGDLVSIPPDVMILFDGLMLFVINFLMRQEERASALGLDRYFLDRK